MVLSKREKSIAIALGVVLGLVVLYEIVYSPLLDWGTANADARAKVDDQQRADDRLRTKEQALQRVWNDIKAGGLKSDPSDAESQLQQGLTDWARESGINLASQRREQRPPEKNGFIQISYQASGTGTTSQVAKLLWQIENTKIPVRINSMQISSRKDGTDDLQIQLNLSTLCAVDIKPTAQNQTKVVSATPSEDRP